MITLYRASILHLYQFNHDIVSLLSVGDKFDTQKLTEQEKTIYSILSDCNSQNTVWSECELAFRVLEKIGVFSFEELEAEIERLTTKALATTSEDIPHGKAVRDVSTLAYIISGSNGTLSSQARQMIIHIAAKSLVSSAFERNSIPNNLAKGNDPLEWVAYIWDLTTNLISKKAFIPFYYIGYHEGLIQNYFGKDYFNPDNRLCVKIPEDCNKQNALVTKLINYFPTILETKENSFERMYAKYGYSGFDYSASRSSKVGISVTETCQLRCEYCSFSSGSGRTLSMSDIKAFVDYTYNSAALHELINSDNTGVRFLIAGGSEATNQWHIFSECVNYIRIKSHETGIKCKLEITTNGCNNPDKTQFIIDNFDTITVSFDGLPAFQNSNRHFADGSSSFDIVNNTLTILNDSGTNFKILCVIRPEDFESMRDIVLFVFSRYPNVRSLTLRPVMSRGRAVDNNLNVSLFDYHFADAFFAMQKSLAFPRKVNCDILLDNNPDSFCGALFGKHPWLRPDGSIVTCQDARDRSTVIGQVKDGIVTLFRNVKDLYAKQTHINLGECRSCELFCHCRGGCPMSRDNDDARLFQSWLCRESHRYLHLRLKELLDTGTCGGWSAISFDSSDIPDSRIIRINGRG